MKVSPEYRRFADPDSLAHALIETVTRQLRSSLAQGRSASLVVPGGRTPVPFFRQLSHAPLQWDRVYVTLTDERWVDVNDAASNERLLREHLLQDAAARAQLLGLRGAPNPQGAADAATAVSAGATLAWQRLSIIQRPFDVVVLGMGEDGHFASLFPGDAASLGGLDMTQPPACIAVRANVAPAQRVSLNLSALLQTQQLVLLVTGERKWQLLQNEQVETTSLHLPVHTLLAQRHTPVTVYWCP
jgi:6-phosphogluconolactonase